MLELLQFCLDVFLDPLSAHDENRNCCNYIDNELSQYTQWQYTPDNIVIVI